MPTRLVELSALTLFSLLLASSTLASSTLASSTLASSTLGPASVAVADPTFDITRGFFTTPQLVTITTATPGASIRYTTNGTLPSATVGTLCTGPVSINRTTPLRAIAYMANQAPSEVVTHTYIFVGDVITQSRANTQSIYGFPATWNGTSVDYGMDTRVTNSHRATIRNDLQTVPSLSVVMATNDLFGSSGIYSNPTRSGVAWERATSLELIDPARPDGSNDFHVDCGIRIHGGAFRNFGLTRKKSFRVLFKSTYGPSKLDYPMFGPDAATQFDTLVFRMESNDGYQWGNRTNVQYARDEFNRRTQLDMGSPASHGRHMHLYLNGVYWGLYNVVERPDASFGEKYFGAKKSEWDGVNSGAPTNNGNLSSWSILKSIARKISSTSTEAVRTGFLMEAQGLNPDGTPNPLKIDYLDVDNYIDYLLINWYTGNADWPRKNYYHGRERDRLDPAPHAGSHTSNGTYFFSWDAEWSLFLNSKYNSTGTITGVAEPYGGLRISEEFRVRFGDRAHRALFNGGALTPQRCLDRYAAITRNHTSILIPELARWGDQHGQLRTVQNWSNEYNRIRNSWLAVRTPALVSILRGAGLYPTLTAPTFSLPAGRVNAGSTLQMSTPLGQIYFTLDGSDPRALGGGVATSATLYSNPLKIDVSTTVRARSRNGSLWSALNEARLRIDSISINEALAKNTTGIRDNFGEREDWIELYNDNPLPVDVGGMFLTDDAISRTRWRIPTGHVIQPGAALLIWADDDPPQGALHASFKLSSAGDDVLLYDTDGATLLSRLTFGVQVADVSTGRLHDAKPHQVTHPEPTPGMPNGLPACGSRRYSSLDSSTQVLDLFLTGTPALGKRVIAQVHGGPAAGHRALLLDAAAREFPLGNTTARLLLSPQFLVLSIKPTGGTGATHFPMTIPNSPPLIGQVVYLQAWGLGAGPWTGSTGLVLKICR